MKSLWKATSMGMVFILSAGLLMAQRPQRGHGGRPGGPRKMRPQRGGGAGAMRRMMFLQRFDKNKDLQIQEDELHAGLEKLAADSAKVHSILLKVFDENKNGKIDPPENRKIQAFLMVVMRSRMLDTNHDYQISEDELGQAWDKLAENCQSYNDFMLKRFDKNQDGKLSAEEIKAAHEQMKKRWQRGRRPGGRPGGQNRQQKKRNK